MSLAIGPKTNSPQRAAAAGREQRFRLLSACPHPIAVRPVQTVVLARTAAERINDERQGAAPAIEPDAVGVRRRSRRRVLRRGKGSGFEKPSTVWGQALFRRPCAAGPALPMATFRTSASVWRASTARVRSATPTRCPAEEIACPVLRGQPARGRGLCRRAGGGARLAGSGRILLDDETQELRAWDVVRVAPEVVRRRRPHDPAGD